MHNHQTCVCVALLSAVVARSATIRRPTTITAGLKKETKKLTKTLKAHRKRLESLLAVRQPATADASLAPQPQALLSQAELHAVLAEIAQLQTSLAAVRQQQRALAAAAATCDSGDSDSDCEDERPMQRRGAATATATAVQPMMLPTQQKQQQQPASSSVVCLQSPLMDQEQPDLCRQLPPPTPHTTSGRVLVCQGKACVRKGALQVLQAVSHATAASPGVEVLPCKCLGKCKQGPAMRVRTEGQPRSSLVTEIEALEVPDILDSLLAAAVAAADV